MINVTCNNNGTITTHGVDADSMECDMDGNDTVLVLRKGEDGDIVAMFRTWVSAITTHPVARTVPNVDDQRRLAVA